MTRRSPRTGGRVMYSRETPQRQLATRVHGAQWVHHDDDHGRLFVWPGHQTGDVETRHPPGHLVDIVEVGTGDVLGNWLCTGTAESAAAAVTERINAGY